MLCQSCKKKPTCVSLCAKAEKYANKDYVDLRESPQEIIPLDLLSHHLDLIPAEDIASYFTEGKPNFPFLTELQNTILQMFHFQGLSYKKIAFRLSGHNKLSLSPKAVERQLARARAEIRGVFHILKGD
jgi:hypothetical protein